MQVIQPGKGRILTVPAYRKTASFVIELIDHLVLPDNCSARGCSVENKLLFNTATSAIMIAIKITLPSQGSNHG
jgi:hypothetical protein